MKLFRLINRALFGIALLTTGEHSTYKVYNKFLGVIFGSNVRLVGRIHFGSEPYLITIGDNVTIADGVRFITHDGGVGLFRKEFPGMNVFGEITIGNNVFIGINAIILPGVTVGNNVVIGVSSVITKNIPDNVIVAGAPAKIVRTTEEYKVKALQKAVFISESNPNKRKKLIMESLRK